MCLCQAYGKTGVPNARGYCLVCGEAVWTDEDPRQAVVAALLTPPTPEMTEDRCLHCGALIGFGVEAFHLGICDDCRQAQGEPEEPVQ